jgi:hypothetical protein
VVRTPYDAGCHGQLHVLALAHGNFGIQLLWCRSVVSRYLWLESNRPMPQLLFQNLQRETNFTEIVRKDDKILQVLSKQIVETICLFFLEKRKLPVSSLGFPQKNLTCSNKLRNYCKTPPSNCPKKNSTNKRNQLD